ncbi:glycosyltransferase [Fibrella aquatilis]|uniref:Glycosyltransferase family 4 protein n=1 Tax=Fibrella aquatilis TaxID=2817059 RepID=A0A939GBY6_9BACT|nr:glycosyltransferase [Fibrella aquatilis]MBO0933588.1 glycosyltransferase family 4 protein [Fibrella aquatilis]
MKPKVALLTDINFWDENSGGPTRISKLVSYLSKHTDLVVIYGNLKGTNDSSVLSECYEGVYVHYLSPDIRKENVEYIQLMQTYLLDHPVDVCILEYLASTFILDYLPIGLPVILDSHDLVSDLNNSFSQYNVPCGKINVISIEDEIALYNRYDYVMMIQQNEYQKVQPFIGRKALLTPHPVTYTQVTIQQKATRVGFVASATNPNLDAIVWFIRNVWPSVYRPGLSLNLFGAICDMLRYNDLSDKRMTWLSTIEENFPGITQFYQSRSLDIEAQPGVILHDYLPNRDQIYTQVDVVINPVRFGSGLKIKNVEALGYGLPLLTTTHGACGLETHVGEALLVADQPADFAQQLSRLLAGYPLRKAVGQAAYQLARSEFSPDACFGPLLAAIQTLQRA